MAAVEEKTAIPEVGAANAASPVENTTPASVAADAPIENATTTPVEPRCTKDIHSLVLDTGPLIKNDPLPTVLREKAEKLYTLPSVIDEIRDAVTRARVETTLLPFIELRNPKAESIAFVTGFARKTGDLAAVSKTDLHLIALAYELEVERNGGDWRLRSTPGQKRMNGAPPGQPEREPKERPARETREGEVESLTEEVGELKVEEEEQAPEDDGWETVPVKKGKKNNKKAQNKHVHKSEPAPEPTPAPVAAIKDEPVEDSAKEDPVAQPIAQDHTTEPGIIETVQAEDAETESDDDDESGWITPANIDAQRAVDSGDAPDTASKPMTLQAALLTSDYAMQNIALRMNLNLIAPSMFRITRLKTWILRCHGCFTITKDTTKQFCPSCGQPTLTRTSCSTDEKGQFKIHLKKNFQFNKRGDRFSVPKPTAGSSNGRMRDKGSAMGGKGGWGRELVMAEDQKEYVREKEERERRKRRDLLDEDMLPDLLTGARKADTGRIRIGAGRNVNSKKRS